MMVNRLTPEARWHRAVDLGILVDPQDEWLLSELTWRGSTKGYVESTHYDGVWRKTVKLSHYIMGTPIWEGEFIDHINRNKLDNRRDNLRWVNEYTSSQNRGYVDTAANIRKASRSDKYEVRVQRNGIRHDLGTFNTIQEAEHAKDKWFQNQGELQVSNRG